MKIERIIFIYDQLKEGKTLKREKLAFRFQCSTRTVTTYFNEIRFGCEATEDIEVTIDPNKKQGIRLIKKRELEPIE